MSPPAFDPKPRVEVGTEYVDTVTRHQMTESEKAKFSLLRWRPSKWRPTGWSSKLFICPSCRRERDLFEAVDPDDPDSARPLLLCAPCLLDTSRGIKTVWDRRRNWDFDVTKNGIRVVIVDGVITEIGEVQP
jgi:hypothetical protein